MGIEARQDINKDKGRADLWPCNSAYALRAENTLENKWQANKLRLIRMIRKGTEGTYQPKGGSTWYVGRWWHRYWL